MQIRPSRAHQWMNCPGSVRLQEPFESDEDGGDNDAAKEGTAAHWVAAQIAEHKPPKVGDVAPNGIVVTEDMLRYGDEYVTSVQGWGEGLTLFEETISVPLIGTKGTPDVYFVDYMHQVLRIRDYKYGFTPVDVELNPQLACYSSGIKDRYELGDTWSVEFSIQQPRAPHVDGHLRSVTYTFAELQPLFDKLKAAADNARSDDPTFAVGSHCKYCKARHACSTLGAAVEKVIIMSKQETTNELSITAAGEELLEIDAALAILKARKTGLEGQIEHGLTNGDFSPHFELGRVQSRTRWLDGVDAQVIQIGAMLGVDLAKPVEAVTPAQAKKLKVDPQIVAKLSYTPIGEVKLVPLKSHKGMFGD